MQVAYKRQEISFRRRHGVNGEIKSTDKNHRELARKRVIGEHINRKLKIFQILADRYLTNN